MNTERDSTNIGDISVDNEVIKNVALKAAAAVAGVHAVRKSRVGRIMSWITGKDRARGVKLEFSNESEVRISLKLCVAYGANIPEVAGEAQENVKKTVEHMTGLMVNEVAIKITCMQAREPARSSAEHKKETAEDEFYSAGGLASG